MKNKSVNKLAGGGGPAEPVLSKAWAGYRTTKMRKALSAFTMAEILLSLTIIGVVAAITLPSLTGNINERTWNTQRKALYARFSQAISLMPALNGYGTVTEDASGSITADTATETFITEGLAKVLKINNICDSDHLPDCGIPQKIVNFQGSQMDMPKTLTQLNSKITSMTLASVNYSQANTKAAAFETQNGESILTFYNPSCVGNMNEMDVQNPSHNGFWYYIQNKICVNFIYDLNGNKGPNTVGKDIGFMSAMYPTDTVLSAPMPVQGFVVANTWDTWEAATKYCKAKEDARMPNLDESSTMFFNQELLGITSGGAWTSNIAGPGFAWAQSYNYGRRVILDKTTSESGVICIKR